MQGPRECRQQQTLLVCLLWPQPYIVDKYLCLNCTHERSESNGGRSSTSVPLEAKNTAIVVAATEVIVGLSQLR